MEHTESVVAAKSDLDRFSSNGFAIVEDVLTAGRVAELITATQFSDAGSTHEHGGLAYANRQALSIPAVVELAQSAPIRTLAESVLRRPVFAVRAILFDKFDGANWKIPWHQDITIATKERHEVEGYGPWSTKDGGPHTQAPTHVLRHMVAIRLHLDHCGEDNGPLRVVAGSHLAGRVKKANIALMNPDARSKVLVCKKGDAILMSPLTVHASSPAAAPDHRRVIHIEYTCCDLDTPLEWAHRV